MPQIPILHLQQTSAPGSMFLTTDERLNWLRTTQEERLGGDKGGSRAWGMRGPARGTLGARRLRDPRP